MAKIKFGWSEVNLVPDGAKVDLAGQFYERISDKVESKLTVTAWAVDSGDDAAIFCSCDLVSTSAHLLKEVRARMASRPDVPADKVMVSAIHTHTAPVISEIRGFFKRDEVYYETFRNNVCRAAAEAIADMKEAVVSISRGKAEGISFVRRFRKKDGSAVTNPPPSMIDQLEGPIGVPDETVQLVKLQRPGSSDIAIVNFGTHPDTLGGTGISPDWPGYLRDTLEDALVREADGHGVKVIFFNGAQGDVIHLNRMNPQSLSGVPMSQHIGRSLAGAVLAIYTQTEPVTVDRVFYQQNMAHVAVAKGTAEQVRIAKELQELFLRKDIPFNVKYEGFPFDVVVARKYLRLEHRDPIIPLNIVCVGFGDVVFVGLPGEPFTATGVKIKGESPFLMTIPCCNANGSEGYFPTDDALLEQGYESSSSLFLPGVAPELEKVSLETLWQLKNT